MLPAQAHGARAAGPRGVRRGWGGARGGCAATLPPTLCALIVSY